MKNVKASEANAPMRRVLKSHERRRVITFVPTESPTQQHMRDECDINQIIARLHQDGVITHVNSRAPVWGTDVSSYEDFQTSMQIVLDARAQFAALHSKVRARFNNDPAEFLAFMGNPENAQEAITLGLATEAEDSPSRTPPEPTTAPPGSPAA